MERSKWQKVKYRVVKLFRIDIPREAHRLKCLVWNAGILLVWYRLFLRKDEFHKSLEFDPFAFYPMSPEKREAYRKDLRRRREIAHRRDLGEC